MNENWLEKKLENIYFKVTLFYFVLYHKITITFIRFINRLSSNL